MESSLVWSLRMRLFHWFLVLAISVAFLSSDEAFLFWHASAGYLVLFLLGFRLYVGFCGEGEERFSNAFSSVKRLLFHPVAAMRETSLDSAGHPPPCWERCWFCFWSLS